VNIVFWKAIEFPCYDSNVLYKYYYITVLEYECCQRTNITDCCCICCIGLTPKTVRLMAWHRAPGGLCRWSRAAAGLRSLRDESHSSIDRTATSNCRPSPAAQDTRLLPANSKCRLLRHYTEIYRVRSSRRLVATIKSTVYSQTINQTMGGR